MINVLFVCHGNICRSTMAEFVFKDMVKKRGIADKFYIASAATSTDEIGNDIHYGTKNKLREAGVPFEKRHARQMTRGDYAKFDFLLGMDTPNIRNMTRISGGDNDNKIKRLLEFTERGGDIADPWFTGNFDVTYDDVVEGCEGFIDYLAENGLI